MEPTKSPRRNRALVWLVAAAATAGAGIGAAGIASAATGSSTSTSNTVATSPSTGNAPSVNAAPADPASLPNGPGETLLTGDAATKVTAAAKAAEPTATIIRVETDSSGHAYEAHVKLADGSVKTLYFTSTFAADGSTTGFGGGPMGGHGPGQPPSSTGSSTNG
jgi:hypothetical protein